MAWWQIGSSPKAGQGFLVCLPSCQDPGEWQSAIRNATSCTAWVDGLLWKVVILLNLSHMADQGEILFGLLGKLCGSCVVSGFLLFIGAFCADSKFQISSSWANCLFFETQRLFEKCTDGSFRDHYIRVLGRLLGQRKNPGCLGYRGLYYPVWWGSGIIINHYKDTYQTISIMASQRFFFVAHCHIWCFEYFHSFNCQIYID